MRLIYYVQLILIPTFYQPYVSFNVTLDDDSAASSDTTDSKSLRKVKSGNNTNITNISLSTASPTTAKALKEDGQKKTRELYGPNEHCYVMDAKSSGNIGRYLNVRAIFLF